MVIKQWNIHYWPVLTFAIMMFSFISTYLIAVVLNHHVYGLFPYISDTGTLPPESCVMSFLFNFGGLSLFINVYIRYKQIEFGISSGSIRITKKRNKIAFWFGFFLSLGLSIAGNFQETGQTECHYIGAATAFMIGIAYFILQTTISRACYSINRTSKYGISRTLFRIRMLLLVVLVISFIVMVICGGISRYQYKGNIIYFWIETDGGFHAHVESAFCEWISVISMLLYIVTFTSEFKRIQYGGIVLINLLEDNSNTKSVLEIS